MLFANIEFPVLAVYVLMVIGFIVMVWGIKNQNTKPNARIFIALGAIMVIGGTVGRLLISPKNAENARLERNATLFQNAKAEKAAQYIASRFQEEGSAVAFLIDEESYSNSSSDNHIMLEYFQRILPEKGISWSDILVVGEMTTDKKTGEEKRNDPLDAAIMKKKLDQVYDKVDVVINFVGLPRSISDLKKITFLTKKNNNTGKNNMFLMTDTGLAFVEQDMLKSGRVCGIIRNSSEESMAFNIRKDEVPKDLSKAFDTFFLLISPDTVSDFIDKNPNYFVSQ
ncbi:MAG: hypothetical protein IKQ16_06600 [Lentisphaeria bacterium]|nr:hypothetical protein [Lentisphaeria bacterium]